MLRCTSNFLVAVFMPALPLSARWTTVGCLACVQVADVRDSRWQEEREEKERRKQDEKKRGRSETASFTFAAATQPPVDVAPHAAASRESSEFGFTTSPVSLVLSCRVYYRHGCCPTRALGL